MKELDWSYDYVLAKVREQFNGITAFLDMSAIYGSEPKVEKALRSKEWDSEKCKTIVTGHQAHARGIGAWCLGTLQTNKEQWWNLPTR